MSDIWSNEEWELIKRVFDEISKLPMAEWDSTLDRYFSGNCLMRQEVEKLLDAEKELLQDSAHDSISGEACSNWSPLDKLMSQLGRKVSLKPGEVLAGRYEIVRRLDRGGMADVYEAKDHQRRQRVALKVVRKIVQGDPSSDEAFENMRTEVNLSLRVSQRNVCRVFDLERHVQKDGQIIFLTMELLPGETLAARLKRIGRLTTTEALEITRQLCDGLQAAHDAGVLHRDLKCNNIMLINSGKEVRSVIADFGIACWTRPEDHLTDPGTSAENSKMIHGTPVYMSPEQLRGDKLTKASDIYSLGLVLYEMVTGRRPFQRGSDESDLSEAIRRLNQDPEAPAKVVPGLSEKWNNTILRCLERDPQKRFSKATEVSGAIDPLVPVPDPVPSPVRTLIRIAAVTALAVMSIMLWYHPEVYAFFHPLPHSKNIEIQPCLFAGTNSADQAFAYGLPKPVIENLSRISTSKDSTWFVPFSEVQGQAQNNNPASALGVNLLVTCELGNTANIWKLNVEVKSAKTFQILRSYVIEVPERQVTSLEDRLLNQIAEMLNLRVPSGILQKPLIDPATDPHAYLLYAHGRGYLAQQKNEQELNLAISLLEKAKEADSKFAIALVELAAAYYREYEYTGQRQWLDKAEAASKQAIDLNGRLPLARAILGAIFQKKGNLDSAIRELKEATNFGRIFDETSCQLATVYDKAGLRHDAEKLIEDALQANPQNWIAQDCLGAIYYYHGQYASAEYHFKQATITAPGSSTAFQNLGAIYLIEGKYHDAINALMEAIDLKPTASACSNLGTAQFGLKHYKDAAVSYLKAAGFRPHDFRLWGNAGDADTLARNTQRAAENYRKAIQELNGVISVNPNDGPMLEFLSLYYAKLGDKKEALGGLRRAETMGAPGENPELLFTSGLIYALLGQDQNALTALQEAIEAGYPPVQIENAPEFDHLRKYKSYKKIMSSQNVKVTP